LLPGSATVNDINDASLMAALGRQMTLAVARETVAASNLANLDTPGYRAREATFEDSLETELGAAIPLARTAHGHLAGPAAASTPGTHELQGASARRDGNTVQLDRELLAMNRAAGDFSAAQTALAAKFRLVRYAINEGR
jgi:flagellar basal-body rod protein FlgB